MKSKAPFIILALCALSACASLTACTTSSQNGEDENIEKSKANTQLVGQDNGSEDGCRDGQCPEEHIPGEDVPDDKKPPEAMPEFRFAPPPEHMPAPADDNDGGDGEEKPPMPAPHRGGKVKPKMPKKGD